MHGVYIYIFRPCIYILLYMGIDDVFVRPLHGNFPPLQCKWLAYCLRRLAKEIGGHANIYQGIYDKLVETQGDIMENPSRPNPKPLNPKPQNPKRLDP